MAHVFLDAEVRDGDVEVHGRGDGDRGEVRGAVRAGADLVERGQVEDAAQVGDAAGVHDRGAHVVDELLGDQLLHVPDRGEHLAGRDRRGGVLPDQAERVLVLGRRRILHPEQAQLLDALAEAAGLDRGEPVVHVVQQVEAETEPFADLGQVGGREVEVRLGAPRLLVRQVRGGGS